MFAKRSAGILMLVVGMVFMLVGSVLAGSEGPIDPANEEASPTVGTTATHQLGWATGALGVLFSLVGIVATANTRRAFF